MQALLKADVTAAVLAGGRATRMGNVDKGLIELNAGRPMIAYVLDAVSPQSGRILINANRNFESYAAFGYPVIKDDEEGFQGPLAGMAACLRRCETSLMLTVPCDGPLLAPDLVERFFFALKEKGADIATASDGKRPQPVFSLLKTSLLSSLIAFLSKGERKIDRWQEQHRLAVVDFSDRQETFLNINTPDDRAALMVHMQSMRRS
jgi:molybdenum cofactor guanylyltransferase